MTALTSSRRSALALFGAIAIGLSLGASQARAASCTVTWVGGHGELWSTAANWSTNAQPEKGANVCLDNSHVAGSYTVVANGAERPINSISIDGSGGAAVSLLIDGRPAFTHGQLELEEQSAGSGVGPHGAIELGSTNNEPTGGTHGGVVVKAGTLVNEGTITSENTNDETPNFIDGNFDNAGSLLVENAFEGNFASWTTSGSIAVEAGQIMRISESSPSSTFTQTAGTIANQGKLEITGGSFAASGSGVATGNPIELEGHISLAPSGSGSATLHLKTGAAKLTSDIAPGYTVLSSGIPGLTHGQLAIVGNRTNRGTLELGSLDETHGTIEAVGGTLTNVGTIVFENTMNGPDGLNGPLVNDGVLRLENPLSGTGQITNAGTMSIPASVTLEAESFTQTATGALSLARAVSSSPPLLLSGTASLAGTVSVDAAGLASGSYPLIAAHSRTGTFGGASISGGSFALGYTAGGVELVPASTTGPPVAPVIKPAGVLHVVSVKGGAGSVTVKLSCSGATGCPAAIKVALIEHLRRGRIVALSAAKKSTTRTLTIASRSSALAAGATRTLTLKLNRAGLALLGSHRALPALVTVSSAGKRAGGASVRIEKPKSPKKR
jgi:hypothetical protein